MIKLMIVDDEPLVCVGIKSMLDWEKYNIKVVATARNGNLAMEQIEKLKPDIVISDIKMPLKTGLELVAESNKKYGRLPLFILLTSYEEFDFVREAVKYQVVEYLIKPELTENTLADTILKAINILLEYRKINPQTTLSKNSLQTIKDKFFIRLYNNLFENHEQFLLQTQELTIEFPTKNYISINSKIIESDKKSFTTDKLYSLCMSTTEIIKETLSKEFNVYITIMDVRLFTITVALEDINKEREIEKLIELLNKTITLVRFYFNVRLYYALGSVVDNPYNLNESYYTARTLLHNANDNNQLVVYTKDFTEDKSAFAFSQIKPDLRKAFEEFDTKALYSVLSKIADYYENNPQLFIEALDIACNILYMAISLLPDGEENMYNIFKDETDSYRCIYKYNATDEVVKWIRILRDGTYDVLSLKKKDYKDQVVQSVKNYIKENLDKRLSLKDVAYIFNFNPNYLSHIFAKYSDCTFVEFITKSKIDLAKEYLIKGDYRINEISEKLGFDNPLYFSKVFKKYVGVSPRDFSKNT